MADRTTSRPLASNFVFATISAGSAALMLVLVYIATRALGPLEFGKFTLAISIATIAEGLMDLGLQQVTTRAIAIDRPSAPKLFFNLLTLKALPGATMLVVMSIVTLFVANDREGRLACFLLLLSAVLRSYLFSVRGVLQGLEHFRHDAIVVVADRALILLIGWIVLVNHGGLIGLSIAFVAARAIALAGALMLVSRHTGGIRLSFDTDLWWDMQRRALSLGAFLIVLNLYSYVDTVILKLMTKSDAELGLYGAAYKIYEGLAYAPAILSSVLTPRLAALWSGDRSRHQSLAWRGINAAAVLGLVIVAVALPSSRWLVVLVSGQEFAPASTSLIMLLTGLTFVFIIWMLHAVAISVFEERLLLRTTLVGLVVNVIVNVLLIPRFGRDGAAIATVMGESVAMVMLFVGLRRVLFGAGVEVGVSGPAGR